MVHISPFVQTFSALIQAASQQTPSNELAARQSPPTIPDIPLSSLPSQCQSGCPVLNTVINCGVTNTSCVCASPIGPQLETCLTCLEAAGPNASLQGTYQSIVSGWNQLCGGHLSLGGSSSPSPSPSPSPSTSGKLPGGAMSLKTAGWGVCVVAATIGAYMVL